MSHDAALICKNGHLINSYYHEFPDDNTAFCSQCGSATIHNCLNCGSEIKGSSNSEYGYFSNYSIPSFCEYCGHPFPWTEAAMESTRIIIQEDDELSEQLKASITESLPDIIVETPRSNLAATRIKKGLAFAGKFTADALRQFIIDFGCELAKNLIGI